MILFTLVLVPGSGCRKNPVEEKGAQSSQTNPVPETVQAPFIPPADTSISMRQLTAWNACNALLDSLTYRYADSFKTEDASMRMRYQDDFIAAQNKICVRAGLPGGYKEYKWIIQNMGNLKNKTLLDSAKAQHF